MPNQDIVPYGEGKEVGEPYRQWGPPGGFPPEPELVEGEVVEEENDWVKRDLGRDWAKERWEEAAQEKAEREARFEAELSELAAEAYSLGGIPRAIEALVASRSLAALRDMVRRLRAGKEVGELGLERERWRFGEEKKRAKREARGRVGALGGKIVKALVPTKKAGMYFPKAQPALYSSGGMRPLTAPPRAGRVPGFAMPTYSLETVRRAGELGGMPHPTGDISALRMKFGMAKEMVAIPGLTQAENLAYQEIHANGDVDSPAHVASELMELGIPKNEAVKAISGLLAKRLVEKVQDKDFPGEPVLQITEGKGR